MKGTQLRSGGAHAGARSRAQRGGRAPGTKRRKGQPPCAAAGAMQAIQATASASAAARECRMGGAMSAARLQVWQCVRYMMQDLPHISFDVGRQTLGRVLLKAMRPMCCFWIVWTASNQALAQWAGFSVWVASLQA